MRPLHEVRVKVHRCMAGHFAEVCDVWAPAPIVRPAAVAAAVEGDRVTIAPDAAVVVDIVAVVVEGAGLPEVSWKDRRKPL